MHMGDTQLSPSYDSRAVLSTFPGKGWVEYVLGIVGHLETTWLLLQHPGIMCELSWTGMLQENFWTLKGECYRMFSCHKICSSINFFCNHLKRYTPFLANEPYKLTGGPSKGDKDRRGLSVINMAPMWTAYSTIGTLFLWGLNYTSTDSRGRYPERRSILNS